MNSLLLAAMGVMPGTALGLAALDGSASGAGDSAAGGGGNSAGDAAEQQEAESWLEEESEFALFAKFAGVRPLSELEDPSASAVQVMLLGGKGGNFAIVRIVAPPNAPARLSAYSIAHDELGDPSELVASWGRHLNSVEAAATFGLLDRLDFWETPGIREAIICDGVRVAEPVPGAECVIELAWDADAILVEAKVGDRLHYAGWNLAFDDNLRQIGEFVLSLAGVRREFWGWEFILGDEWTTERAANWALGQVLPDTGGADDLGTSEDSDPPD